MFLLIVEFKNVVTEQPTKMAVLSTDTDLKPANEEWPTLVELNSLSQEERRLEELDDEKTPWMMSDAFAKVVVIVVPFVVIVVIIGIIYGVRACRKAEKLRKFQERMKSIDVDRW